MAGEFPAVPLILDHKAPGRAHLVVGDVMSHVVFLREHLGGSSVTVETATDLSDLGLMDRLARPGTFILTTGPETRLALAPDVRRHYQLWSAKPIKRRTSAIKTLCREAMAILGMTEPPPKDGLDLIGDRVIDQCGEEAMPQAMIWAASWLLTDAVPVTGHAWAHPWSDPWAWGKVELIGMRLNVLHRDLVAWVYAKIEDKAGIEKMGLNPSRVAWLRTQRIDPDKAERALTLLSSWRSGLGGSDFQTALRIGRIFAK